MTKRITNAKIACVDFSLQKVRMKLGIQSKILNNLKPFEKGSTFFYFQVFLSKIENSYLEKMILPKNV